MTNAIVSKLSIIIPVGHDDHAWQHLLKALATLGKEIEIIISACQIQAKAVDLPDNVIWLQTSQGRARQLNAGAIKACGNILWFLHADTSFTTGIIETMRHFIKADEPSMGYCKLKFAQDGPKQIHLNAWAANIRSRYLGLPFGDQGFMMHRSLFEQMNGFDESIKIGEDLDFVVRVQASGVSLLELPTTLLTSGRRYQQNGWFYTTLQHIYLTWYLTRQAKRRLMTC